MLEKDHGETVDAVAKRCDFPVSYISLYIHRLSLLLRSWLFLSVVVIKYT